MPGHVIYCILLQQLQHVSHFYAFPCPRSPFRHFRVTLHHIFAILACCLISVIIIHFSVSSRQAAGGKSLSCDNFSTPVVVSCPVGSDPAERKQQPSTVAVTVCSGV